MNINYFLLAFCVSIDSFGIGITYGMKNTKISLLAKIILFTLAIIIANLSMSLGQVLLVIFPTLFVRFLGAVLFVLMGSWIIYQTLHSPKDTHASSNISFKKPEEIHTFFIQCLGITIQIIRNPSSSDLDHSHRIDWKEAFFLGIALSLDLFCVGIGSSIIGFNSILFPFLVATFQLCFLSLGKWLGKRIITISKIPESTWNLISGVLLIGFGLIKIFF